MRILCRAVRRHLTVGSLYIVGLGETARNSSPEGPLHNRECRDFDDGSNAFWSLFSKQAKTHDEAQFERVKEDMDGAIVFVRVLLQCENVHRIQRVYS